MLALRITFKTLQNRMSITFSYLGHENKAILILKILSQVHKS